METWIKANENSRNAEARGSANNKSDDRMNVNSFQSSFRKAFKALVSRWKAVDLRSSHKIIFIFSLTSLKNSKCPESDAAHLHKNFSASTKEKRIVSSQ